LIARAVRARRLRSWPTLGVPATLALTVALFVGVFALREADSNVSDAVGTLYVLPIAVLALRFGLRGGLAGILVSFALVAAWGLYGGQTGGTLNGYLVRGVAFSVLGLVLGAFVDERRRLGAEISRYYEVSVDLLVTADQQGRFIRVSPSWERTLGHSAETLCSQLSREFVHPDDRAVTTSEAVAGSRDTVTFRNRFRTADGSYRWLQWSASGSPSDGVIYGTARDITEQVEAEQSLADNAIQLEANVVERTRELEEARAETLHSLTVAAEFHDDETAEHAARVGANAAAIAAALGLDAEQVALIREGAPLHDVGKLAIPDRILLKRAGLNPRERDKMQSHAALGARVLSGSHAPVLAMAAVIAASHHEHWDGGGYPLGLAGEAIPLAGRIVAVADVYDALTHERPYKPAWPIDKSRAEIQHAAGSQFDPRVVAAFLAVQQDTTGPATVKPHDAPEPERPSHRSRDAVVVRGKGTE
jgi:PAS domain S-box-containing protein